MADAGYTVIHYTQAYALHMYILRAAEHFLPGASSLLPAAPRKVPLSLKFEYITESVKAPQLGVWGEKC